jgi:hypothetical protein
MNVSPGYVVHPNNSLSNGSISSSVISAPGIAPYSFVWSDTSTITTPFRTALGPGTYRLTVTDSAYQPAVRIVSFTLINYSVPMTAVFGSVQSGPQNAIITQSYVYGGVPPYSVKWTPPIEYPDLLPQQALPAGNYTVSVSDSINSATISSIYTIPVIYSLSLVAQVPTSSHGAHHFRTAHWVPRVHWHQETIQLPCTAATVSRSATPTLFLPK